MFPPEKKQKYIPEPSHTADDASDESLELVTLESRCSPKSFRSVVSQFSDVKKAACEELGFGVLLKIAGTRLRHSMVPALVDLVDPEKGTIQLHGKLIEIFASDVAQVMGLQNGGEEVIQAGSFKDHPELMDIVSQFSRSDGKIYSKELVRYLVDPQMVADDKFK